MVDVYNAETGKNEMKTEKVALQLKIEGVEKYLLTVYNPAEATTPNTAQSKYFVYKNTYEKISTLTPEASLNMCRFSGLPVAVKAKSVNKFTSGNFNVTLTLKDDTIVPLKFDTQANLITSSILCKNKTYTIQKS